LSNISPLAALRLEIPSYRYRRQHNFKLKGKLSTHPEVPSYPSDTYTVEVNKIEDIMK